MDNEKSEPDDEAEGAHLVARQLEQSAQDVFLADAFQAQQRLVGNQSAMEVLIGLLSAFVGVLPDRNREVA